MDVVFFQTSREQLTRALHGLGVDVHDALFKSTVFLDMVLTVEPGIYIPQEGLGVRIEDDIINHQIWPQ